MKNKIMDKIKEISILYGIKNRFNYIFNGENGVVSVFYVLR
jgi:hypothetical protein